jgi:hypothetical protein
MLIPMEAANSAVLAVFEQEVLHPAVTDTVIKKAVAKFKASQREKPPTLIDTARESRNSISRSSGLSQLYLLEVTSPPLLWP